MFKFDRIYCAILQRLPAMNHGSHLMEWKYDLNLVKIHVALTWKIKTPSDHNLARHDSSIVICARLEPGVITCMMISTKRILGACLKPGGFISMMIRTKRILSRFLQWAHNIFVISIHILSNCVSILHQHHRYSISEIHEDVWLLLDKMITG